MKKKSWSFLSPGDIVHVIAPASNSPINKLQDGLKWLEEIGLCPDVPSDIVQTDLFFAAPLSSQLLHMKAALESDAKAIWCLRGGYGSMRLIPHLKKMKPPKKPKLFIGFSDITALHLFFSQEWNWPVIHGHTVSQMSPETRNSPDRELLRKMIFGTVQSHTYKGLLPMNHLAEKSQLILGEITGGNLRILQSSLGTDWELQAKGKILFLEDVGERGYSIDRMLEQLVQAGIIDKGLKAVIFGDFTEGLERDGKDLTWDALQRFAERAPYPVLRGLPSGHGRNANYPLPFNTRCELKTGRRGKLICSFGGAQEILAGQKKKQEGKIRSSSK
jgi:muramoyltetrapeptide carboxypeptidase